MGLDFYGDSVGYNTEIAITNINDIVFSKCIIDEIKIDDVALAYTNSNKEEWNYDTILLAKFENTLEAGNIQNRGVPIEYLRFKKRKKDSLKWNVIADIPFEETENIYNLSDRIVQGTELYEYAVVPLTSGIEGAENRTEIECSFDGLWLVDKTQGIRFFTNLEYSDIENVTKVAVFEPLQSKYPYTQTLATDYHKSSISSVVISDNTLDGNGINARQERLLRENIFAFLKNRKPKMLKDGLGRCYLIMILGSPKEKPFNSVAGAIAGVSFDWIEIGDAFNDDDLRNANLI